MKFLTLAPFAMVMFSVVAPLRSRVVTSPLPFRVRVPPLAAFSVVITEP